jgi:MFS family permease
VSDLLAPLRPPRPLSRREIVILALFSIVALTTGWSGSVITHALPFVQDDLGISDAGVFELMAIIRAAALAAIALSWWGDRAGRRRPMLVGFGLLTAGNLATAFFPGLAMLTLTQSIARIGTIGLGALAIVVLAEEVEPGSRGYSVGVFVFFASVGTGLGLLLRPVADLSHDAWRWLFALSALPLLVLPFLSKRLAESRAFIPSAVRRPLAAVVRSGRARRFWPLAILSFGVAAFTGPAANLALLRLQNDLAWSTGSASLMLALTSAPGVTLGVLLGGRMADIAGRRPTQFVAIALGVAGGILFYMSANGWVAGAGITVSTFGAFAFAPAFASHRSELFPTDLRATAAAWINNAGIFGGLTGFAAGRFVVDSLGIPRTVSALGLFLLAVSFVVFVLPETKGITLTGEAESLDPPSATPG